MNSINTNYAAMTALQSLNNTNKGLQDTQARIATGLRVGSAQDNAAYWSMATTLRSDNKALSAVGDALGLGAATIDVAYTAMNSAIDVVSEMKAKLVAARQPGVDRTKVQGEIDELQNQLRSIGNSATFSGENWLSVDTGNAGVYTASETIVAGFSRAQGQNGAETSIATISVDVGGTYLFDTNSDGAGGGYNSGSATADALGILGSNRLTRADADAAGSARGSIDAAGTFVIASAFDPTATTPAAATGANEIDISSASDADIEDYIQGLDAALSEMTSAATDLGSSKKRIDLQKTFVGSLMDSMDRGVSTLVDADMTAESTKLQALQVQQQLGVQALSIANSQTQNVLSLFR